jgi:hypothetical protein
MLSSRSTVVGSCDSCAAKAAAAPIAGGGSAVADSM